MKGELTMRQPAACLESVNDQIARMETEYPKHREEMEPVRDNRKRVKYLLRQAVAQSNLEG